MALENFGDRLQKLRKSKRLTQEELGEKVGLARTTIASIENGRQAPTISMLQTLRDEFRVSYEYLIDGVEVFSQATTKELEAEIVQLKSRILDLNNSLDIAQDYALILKEKLKEKEKE